MHAEGVSWGSKVKTLALRSTTPASVTAFRKIHRVAHSAESKEGPNHALKSRARLFAKSVSQPSQRVMTQQM